MSSDDEKSDPVVSPSKELEALLETSYSTGALSEGPQALAGCIELARAIRNEAIAHLERDNRITRASKNVVGESFERLVNVVQKVVGLNGFLSGRVFELKNNVTELKGELKEALVESVKGEMKGISTGVSEVVSGAVNVCAGECVSAVTKSVTGVRSVVVDSVQKAVGDSVKRVVDDSVGAVVKMVDDSVKRVVDGSVVEVKKACEGVTTYAGAVGAGGSKDGGWQVVPNWSSRVRAKKPDDVVFLYPEEKDKPVDFALKKFKEVVDPRKKGVSFKEVRGLKDGGVAVVVRSKDEANRIRECEELKGVGVRVAGVKLQRPRVLVYDVPSDVVKEELVCCIFEQNGFECEKGEFIDGCKEVSRVNGRDGNVNVVLECSARVRDLLRERGRLGVEFNYCRVIDFLRPVRCFKCLGFGHTQGGCREKVACAFCGGEHLEKDCGVKRTERAKCVNCMRVRKPHDHSVKDVECPVYKRALERTVMRTDYVC